MKYSKFNTIIDKSDHLLIYNSLSGALLKINKEKIKEAEDILCKKGILVEDDKNENLLYKYIYYRKLFSSKELYLTIAPTTDCNLCCPYCFEEGNRHKEYMDDETLNSIIQYIISKKNRKIHLVWFGGEPLLCHKKISTLSEELTSNEINFSASIITNGTLFNDSIIKNLPNLNLSNIQITFDGNKDKHNKKRFFQNHKSTFDLIIKNVDKLLKGTNIQLIVKMNIDKENISSCKELLTLLNDKYKSYIDNNRLKIKSNYIRNRTNFEGHEKCLTEDEYLHFQNQIEHKNINIPNLCYPCPLRNQNDIIIGPDGSIYKCLEFIGNKSKSIGNIKNFSISISKLAEHAFAYDPFEDQECKDCSILPICGGGCPNDRALKAVGKNISLCPSIKRNLPTIIENMFNEQKHLTL